MQTDPRRIRIRLRDAPAVISSRRQVKRRGRKIRMVRLPALQATKAELYRLFLASGVRKAELVHRLRILRHRSRLDQIEAAFQSLGKEIHIEVRPAA